jgi:acyl carrier protein
MSVAEQLEKYVLSELADPGVKSLSHDDDLLTKGIIDSLGIIQLTSFVEERFGISVGPDEIVPENFRNISSLAQFIERKVGEK